MDKCYQLRITSTYLDKDTRLLNILIHNFHVFFNTSQLCMDMNLNIIINMNVIILDIRLMNDNRMKFPNSKLMTMDSS
jgi:hypothetical protein